MEYDQYQNQKNASSQFAGAPTSQPSADTFTGQMAFIDELIGTARILSERVAKQADQLVPANQPTDSVMVGKIGRIEAHPDAGPLLFRLQNRNQELNRIFSEIARQLSRIDQVL